MAHSDPPTLARSAWRATLWLNRSSQGNRMDNKDLGIFGELLNQVDTDLEIRVLQLRAHGRTFCSGYDLDSLAPDSSEGTPGFDRIVDRLENLRIPTIAALTGSVYGGGTDLALACDFRVGVPGIEFAMPAARLGIHYYYSGMRRYVTRLGLGAAKRLFLYGDRIGTDEMLRLGVLDEIVENATLDARLEVLSGILAANAPAAVQGMKLALNGIADGTANAEAVDQSWRRSLSSADLRESLSARSEKRQPRFEAPATAVRNDHKITNPNR
jgi:enoyl-CoA hydratase